MPAASSGRGPRSHAVQAGRPRLVRRLHCAPWHEQRTAPGGRARIVATRPSRWTFARRPGPDPPPSPRGRCCSTAWASRRASTPATRRCSSSRLRRRGLHPHAAGHAADQPYRHRHRIAARDAGLGQGARRPPRDRSQPADCRRTQAHRLSHGGPHREPHADRPALRTDRRGDRAPGKIRPDRRSRVAGHHQAQACRCTGN